MSFFDRSWKRRAKREWTSAFRRPFLVEKRHRYRHVLRRQRPALRAIAHPSRGRLTIDDLKLWRRRAA